MSYECEIILGSIGPNNIPLVTMRLRYPRYIHPELLTHRLFSRNSKSSRAKPIKKYIQEILLDPVVPPHFGAAKKGMQASKDEAQYKGLGIFLWNISKYVAISSAYLMDKLNIHKQVTNRILEPYLYIDTLVTGTSYAWNNFFALRCGLDGAADPAIQIIARMCARAYREHKLIRLNAGEWHLPYITDDDIFTIAKSHAYDSADTINNNINLDLCKISAARCARISYYNFDTNKKSTIKEDMDLYDKLVGGKNIHASPLEHQALAISSNLDLTDHKVYKYFGNLYGWKQFRKIIPNESHANFALEKVDNERFKIY